MKRQEYEVPCGHYAPDSRIRRIVQGHKPGFEAQLIHCGKCGGWYYAPFNTGLLPPELQEILDRDGIVSSEDVYGFLGL